MGRIPVHPILLAIFPIVSLYQANQDFAAPGDLGVPMLTAMAAAGLVWGVLWGWTRDARRSAQSVSVLVVLFYGLGMGQAFVNGLLMYLSNFWVRSEVSVPFWVAALPQSAMAVWLLGRIWRGAQDPLRVDSVMNLVGLALVVVPVAGISPSEFGRTMEAPYQAQPLFRAEEVRQARRPDIFYILLDGYARGDVLRELFDLDNEPFLRGLEQRGFQVARKSHSNYPQTMLSLASSLNARYLENEAPVNSGDRDPLQARINGNAVTATLKGLGYRVVSFDSGFDHSNLKQSADEFRSAFPRRSLFQEYLISQSLLREVIALGRGGTPFDQARTRFDHMMRSLSSIAADPRPTFTFAHVLLPHPPFLHRADGRPFEEPGTPFYLLDGDAFHRAYGDDDAYVLGYREQVAYLNKRVLAMLDEVLKASAEPPVIILQSDHGSGLHFELNDLETTDLRERFGNLTAALLPAGSRPLRQDITPVNLFRVVFREVFGAPVEELSDRCYFAPFSNPYRFTDVTEELRVSEGPSAWLMDPS